VGRCVVKAALTRRALFGAAFATFAPGASTDAAATWCREARGLVTGDDFHERMKRMHAAILSVKPIDYVRWLETGEGQSPIREALERAGCLERTP
jgi:hypothetical protein